jgi:glyoxylase-like metal-dependent hydrolase (beta-lactamase superfamily II)
MSKVHRIQDRFVNMYLIEEAAGLTLIDAGLQRSAVAAVRKTLTTIGRKPGDITRILITHADPDHTGGARALVELTGAALCASQIEAGAIAQGKAAREPALPGFVIKLSALLMGNMAPATVSQILNDGDELPVLGGLRVVATPGHTPGHTSYFSASIGALFAGDSLNTMKGDVSFFPAPVHWRFETGRDSARKQSTLNASMVYCGHGAPNNTWKLA